MRRLLVFLVAAGAALAAVLWLAGGAGQGRRSTLPAAPRELRDSGVEPAGAPSSALAEARPSSRPGEPAAVPAARTPGDSGMPSPVATPPVPAELSGTGTARVRGVVLDPRGACVSGAAVSGSMLQATAGDGLGEERVHGERARTDERGAFELRLPTGGELCLTAEHPDLAPSWPVELALAPGELRDIVLQLRVGATILGELVGADGRPDAGREVRVSGGGAPQGRSTATGADGEFEFRGLPPGELTLAGTTSDGLELRASLVLGEGETERVHLRAPEAALVRLHGRVRAGGEPVKDALLRAEREERSASRSTRTDDAGEYELELPAAGRYLLALDSSLSWRTSIDVPDVADFRQDLTLCVGRISGRVTGEGGEPLADFPVETEPERHEPEGHGSARTRTDEEGRYELLVPCGLHAVRAGAEERGAGNRAWARVGGMLVTAGASFTDVDLVLAPGGALAGVVRTEAGEPVSRADLWSFEAPRPRWLGTTGGDGRFRLTGLERGTLWLGASLERSATRRRVPVEVEPGTTQQVELELAPAAPVLVQARRSGALVDSELALADEDGTTYPGRSERPGEACYGPLTAGRYVVSARLDGTRVERRLEILGSEQRLLIELAFD